MNTATQSNPNQPRASRTVSAIDVIRWIEDNAESVFIQQTGRRSKNRAVVQYRAGNEVKAVGGATIAAAVQKAKFRQQAADAAKGVSL